MRFLYGFLKPWGRGYGFLSSFPPFSFIEEKNVRGGVSLNKIVGGCVSLKKTGRGFVNLKKYKSHGKAVVVTLNSKVENS